MKTIILRTTLLLVSFAAMAEDDRYTAAMRKNIHQVYLATTPDELLQSVNAFDRIGNAEKNKWEPFYYEAFGYVMLANREGDTSRKDAFLDQAQAALDRASALTQNESELVAMDGFISMIRLTVDPATRGQQYSGKAMQAFEKAVVLNPENPRALGLLAQMQFGTARFFHAATTEACATAQRALEKFGSYTSENPLAPVWGKGMVEDSLRQCK